MVTIATELMAALIDADSAVQKTVSYHNSAAYGRVIVCVI